MELKHAPHPYWQKWAQALIRHPAKVLFGCSFVAIAMAIQAALTPLDLSFTGLLDQSNPEIRHYRETVATFGANTAIVILLEGEPEEIARVIDALVKDLPKRAQLGRIIPPADPQWLIERAPWLWGDPMFRAAVRSIDSQKTSRGVLASIKTADNFIRKSLRPDERVALVNIAMKGSPLDVAMGGQDYRQIEDAATEILAELGADVKMRFTGMAAVAAQDQSKILTRIKILTPITLIAVLFMLLGVETRISRVIAAGLALGGSVCIAFGMTGLIQGKLIITTTFFGMLLLGLGIDFGIHLLVALRDARAHGLGPDEALDHGIEHTGTAIVLGGISTALAFGVVALVPEPGARDMGLCALFGLTSAMILMLTFLPSAWLILERRHRGKETPVRFNLPGLHATVEYSIHHPKLVLLAGFVLTAAAGAGIPRYHLETDLREIMSRNVPALEVEERLREVYGMTPVSYLAPVESLEVARQWAEKLALLPSIAKTSSAGDLVRPDSAARLAAMQKALASIRSLPSTETSEIIERLRRAVELGPITLENLPGSLTSGIIGKGGKLAVVISPRENLLEAHGIVKQLDEIRAIAPTATGMPVIAKTAILGTRDYVPILIPVILVVVTLVLAVSFRNFIDIGLGLLPVIVGTTMTFGAFFWLDLQFNVLTGAVVPVILGLGVDDGIHVVARIRKYTVRTSETILEAVEGVGRAIFLTTATTTVSFLGLLLTDHAGMESIAKFMIIGIPLCFVASVTVLPAAAILLAKREDAQPKGR